MDGEKTKKFGFPVSIRSLILVVAGSALLITFVTWGFQQSRKTEDALTRAIAAEKAVADANAGPKPSGKLKSLRDEAIKRAANRNTKEDEERSRQLAEEIDNLSHIRDKIQEDLYRIKAQVSKGKEAPPPSLDALRDPRNRDRSLPTEPNPGSP